MADEALEEEDVPTGGGVKKLVLVAVPTLLAGIAGGFFLRPVVMPPEEPLADGAVAAESEGALAALDESVITSLGDFTVNLRDSAGGRLLQMSVSVEGPESKVESLEERKPQLRDSILLVASDYAYEELEGMGKLQLRDDILGRIKSVTTPETAERVYFTSFLIQ